MMADATGNEDEVSGPVHGASSSSVLSLHEVVQCTRGTQVQWEWCDSLLWVPYSVSASETIEKAFQAGEPSLALNIGQFRFKITFQHRGVQQKNLSSGRTRPVKRETKENGNVSWMWWQVDGQCWYDYEQDLACQLERAWKACDTSRNIKTERAPSGLYFSIRGQAYHVEFEGDATQCNVRTWSSRNVRRNLYKPDSSLPLTAGITPIYMISSLKNAPSSSCGANDIINLLNGFGQNDDACSTAKDKKNSDGTVVCSNQLHVEDCAICLCALAESTTLTLSKCKHVYHQDCIESWFKTRPSCPECLTVYGTIIGTQPPGEMRVRNLKATRGFALPGYLNTDVIEITYKFHGGIQTAEHPNPGRPYSGTTRTAYLPKNKDGEEVLELLKKAWNRRLLFRIGTSVTTGQPNTVVWSGVHHKTRMTGGSSYHGYPDETYFERVKQELQDVGVC